MNIRLSAGGKGRHDTGQIGWPARGNRLRIGVMDRKDYDPHTDAALDEALAETFPASDPVAISPHGERERGRAAPRQSQPLKGRDSSPTSS